jgi:hypothetical protein
MARGATLPQEGLVQHWPAAAARRADPHKAVSTGAGSLRLLHQLTIDRSMAAPRSQAAFHARSML